MHFPRLEQDRFLHGLAKASTNLACPEGKQFAFLLHVHEAHAQSVSLAEDAEYKTHSKAPPGRSD